MDVKAHKIYMGLIYITHGWYERHIVSETEAMFVWYMTCEIWWRLYMWEDLPSWSFNITNLRIGLKLLFFRVSARKLSLLSIKKENNEIKVPIDNNVCICCEIVVMKLIIKKRYQMLTALYTVINNSDIVYRIFFIVLCY